MPPRADSDATLDIQPILTQRILVTLLGTSPLICNSMSGKAKRELLAPRGRASAAIRAASPKHDVLAEYRESVVRLRGADAPTLIALPSTAFKSAIGMAALDIPGARKAQIGRLVYVEGELVAVYGEPKLHMTTVRMDNISHTPDIRTRAILPAWGCRVTIRFVVPLLNPTTIANLVAAAGVSVGVGDFRPEKGKGSYGQFEIVGDDDPRFLALRADARGVQERALADPECYDDESRDLFDWFETEARRRGQRSAS